MNPKIDVVITTSDLLTSVRAMIDSLDRQSLEPEEIDITIVDDGADNRSRDRLEMLALHRPNVRVLPAPDASSLGQRKNLALSSSRADYILWLDQSTELRENALEKVHTFAEEHDSDIVFAKTAVHHAPGPGADLFAGHDPRAPKNAALAGALTAQKVYRSKFLIESGTEFATDVDHASDRRFDLLALSRTDKVGVLADTPCFYLAGPSKPPAPDKHLTNLLAATDAGELRDEVLTRWTRSFVSRFVRSAADVGEGSWDAYVRTNQDQLQRVPSGILERLGRPYVEVVSSLRDGDAATIRRAVERFSLPSLSVNDVGVDWQAGGLKVNAGAVVHPGSFDVAASTDDLEVRLSAYHSGTGVEWTLPTPTVRLTSADTGPAAVVVELESIAGESFVADKLLLEKGEWLVVLEVRHDQFVLRQRLPHPGPPVATAIIAGTPIVSFAVKKKLALDVGAHNRAVVGKVSVGACSLSESVRGTILSIDLPDVKMPTNGTLDGSLEISDLPVRASLVAAEGGSRLEACVSGLAGSYPLATTFSAAKPASTGLALSIDGVGQMSVVPVAPRRPTAPSAKPAGRTPASASDRLRSAVASVPAARAAYRRIRTIGSGLRR